MSRTRTRFVANERRLVIGGIPKGHDPSELLLDLLDHGLLEDSRLESRRRSQTLTLVLAERNGLPPNNLLRGIAEQLSRRPQHRVVYDPWTVGGKPVDIVLAADLIGDVFRHTTQARLPVTSRQ